MASAANEPFTRFSARIESHGEDSFPWDGAITTENLLVFANGGDTPSLERAAQLLPAANEIRKRLVAGEIVSTGGATIFPCRGA